MVRLDELTMWKCGRGCQSLFQIHIASQCQSMIRLQCFATQLLETKGAHRPPMLQIQKPNHAVFHAFSKLPTSLQPQSLCISGSCYLECLKSQGLGVLAFFITWVMLFLTFTVLHITLFSL